MIPAVWGQIVGGMILLMLLTFCGIWIWAWHGRHRPAFDALARLPMDEEDQPK